jgi:hypothetical protein
MYLIFSSLVGFATFVCTNLNSNPWMDKETTVTVQNKRKKWKKYIYCKSPQNKELYDEAKEDSRKKVRKAQMRYEKEIWYVIFTSN